MRDQRALSYKFGPFLLVVKERALWKGKESVCLTPKEFETLHVLVRDSGRLVTKDQILEEVWPDSFVADGSLSRNVSVLRRVLGEGYIQTVPKAGYRFTGSVRSSDAESPTNPEDSSQMADLAVSLVPLVGEVEPIGICVSGDGSPRSPGLGLVTDHNRNYAIRVLACLLLVIAISTPTLLVRRGRGHQTSGSEPFARLLVLPVQNLTALPDQDYISDGLTEEIIARLGKIDPSSLGVIAPTSARRLKDSARSPIQLGRELHVGYVLVSALRHKDSRIRISMQLVRVTDEVQMWAAEYERDDQDLFGIPNEIALSIGQHLRLRSAVVTTPQEEGTNNSEAYEDYLKGRFFLE